MMRFTMSDRLRRLAASTILGGILGGGLVAAVPTAADELPPRSLADWQERPVDRLRRPRYEEGPSVQRTQRGWQIRSQHFTVLSGNSRADAEWAAAEVADAWQGMERLANHWTRIHQSPDFALDAVLVVLADADELRSLDDRRRDPGDATEPSAFKSWGGPMLIRLSKEAGEEPDAAATARLRHAVAHAFLHAGHFDQQFPAWACEGLARYTAREGVSPEDRELALENLRMPMPITGRIVGELDEQDPGPAPEASDAVTFLLEGDDAAHAGTFFTALQETSNAARPATPWRSAVTGPGPRDAGIGPGPRDAGIGDGPLEALAEELEPSYTRWREDPLNAQPRLEDVERLPAELTGLDQQLAFVLKMLQRFGDPARTRSRAKVQEFGRPATETVQPAPLPRDADLRQMHRRLLESDQFWATLGPDGRLLLASDDERMAEALELLRDPRLTARRDAQTWEVRYSLPDGRKVKARLEEAKAPATRPEVRFELLDRPAGR